MAQNLNPAPPEAPAPPTVTAKPGRYLTFALGRESYGLPVLQVREIIRLCPVTLVPRMPPYIKGVINLRGKVIPIMDLRARFQLPSSESTERTCIIVVQFGEAPGGGNLMGAVVDTVEEVVNLAQTELEPVPDFGGKPDTQYILGMATVRGGVKTLLDLEKIFLETGAVSLPPSRKPDSPNAPS
jgi:purine-binding chemotaxis protein CheW